MGTRITWTFLLHSLAGLNMVASDIYLNGSYSYIENDQPFTLTCRSDEIPFGNAAIFLRNGTPTFNVVYLSSRSKCYGVLQTPDPIAFECTNNCSCSADLKSYTLTHIGTYSSRIVIFRCEMTTDEGGKKGTDLIVNVSRGPSLVSLDPSTTNITVNEGQQVGPITCKADCVPDCTYRWSGPEVIGDISVLQFYNIQRSRNGTYTCIANNTYGISKVDMDVVIQYGPGDIILKPSDQTYTIKENQSVGPVTCTSSCNPVCAYQWTGPGITQTSNQLHITQIKRGQIGQFTCNASNVVSSVQKHVNITVQYGPSSQSLNPSTTLITVNEGQQVGPINCTADCVPNCTYIWSGPEMTVDISVLQINNIQRSRNGTYSCTATNKYGSRNVSVDVIVQYGPDEIVLTPTNQTYTIIENQSVGPVTCTSSCYPVCTYQWSGPEIAQSSNQLHIPQIKRGQAGQFTCRATNVVSSLHKHINITVQYGPSLVSLDPSTTTITVNEGQQTGPITCSANCVPICTYRWSGPEMTGTISVLQINNIQRSRNGTYTCTATNTYGSSKVDVDVVIQYGPNDIVLNPKNQTYTIEENQSAGPVTCTSSCHPVCIYQWTGPGITQTSNQLHITQIKRGQTGQFTCNASNVVSSVQKHITITVQYAAMVMYLSADLYKAHENSSITFTCGADGVPIPTLALYFTDTLGSRYMLQSVKNTTSQYHIPLAKCNDTGTYLCKADNGFHSTSNISKDVIVTCPPRLRRECSSGSLIYVTSGVYTQISVCLISNPVPRINWTAINDNYKNDHIVSVYQNSSILYTSVLETKLTDKSKMQYSLIAENSFGKTDAETFTLELKDKPDAPSAFTATSIDSTSVVLSWKGGFNGGTTQIFNITYKMQNTDDVFSITKPEVLGSNVYDLEIQNLIPSTIYSFTITATNSGGTTTTDNTLIIKTSAITVQNDSKNGQELLATSISLSVIGLLALVCSACLIACWRVRMIKKKSKSDDNYTEFDTKRSTEANAYDNINQTTDIDTNRNRTLSNDKSANNYEECQPYNRQEVDYYNMNQKPKDSKIKTGGAEYANLKF